ncbi:unnamed protein product [Lasius platythorax]|uniref:Uncharacterized protein n=1 Tax=Lasius platythorax TaxID=488582 RepID=A0AAV2NZ46_9HYME
MPLWKPDLGDALSHAPPLIGTYSRCNVCLTCARRHMHASHRQEVDNSQLANTNKTTSSLKLPGMRQQRA